MLVIRTFGLPHTPTITNIRITPYPRHHQYSDHPTPSPSPTPHHPIPPPSPTPASPHIQTTAIRGFPDGGGYGGTGFSGRWWLRRHGVFRTVVVMTARGFPDVRFTRTSHVAVFVGLNHSRYAREHKASLRLRDSGGPGFSGRWWLRRHGVFRTSVSRGQATWLSSSA